MKFEKRNIVLFMLGTVFFIILIAIATSINLDEKENTETKIIPNTTVTKVTNTPTPTNEIITSTSTPPKPTTKAPKPDKQERDKTWNTTDKSYFAVATNFRKEFTNAVNTNTNNMNIILGETSPVYKATEKKIIDFKKQKINIELKGMSLVGVKEISKTEVLLKTKEKIGIKKANETAYKYKDYNVEYTFNIKNDGLIIKNIKGGI